MRFPSFSKVNKKWVILALSLGIGLVAAFFANQYLKARMDEIEKQSQVKQVAVVVASQDIPEGTPVSNSSMAVREMPANWVQSNTVLPEQFERIEGRKTTVALKGGEVLMWPMLEGLQIPTFSKKVAAGRRAITIPVDEISSISGLLEPGDLIDLFLLAKQKAESLQTLLLENVRVLAAGKQLTSGNVDPNRSFSTVTIDVSVADAQLILSAQDMGKIQAVLRNPDDSKPTGIKKIDRARVMEASDVASRIPVIYGGRSAQLDSIPKLGAPAVPAKGGAEAASVPTPPGMTPLQQLLQQAGASEQKQ